MATIDDILTTQKNGVVALNAINQATAFQTFRLAGKYRSLTVTSLTQVASGPGILIAYTTVIGGSATGSIYDSITPLTTKTSGTGGGTPLATVTFTPNYSFSVGDTVIVKNVSPSGYNTTGSTVISSTANSVTYSNATTGNQTNSGFVFNPNPTNVICTTSQTVLTFQIGAPFTTGLVINPGSGQSINVIYTLD